MNKAEIRNRIDHLNVWKSGDIRAPHKPLLLLYALGRLQNGQRLIPYAEADRDLKKLLIEFGPVRKSYHPEFPFWHLQSDGLWELDQSHQLEKRKAGPPRQESLRHHHQPRRHLHHPQRQRSGLFRGVPPMPGLPGPQRRRLDRGADRPPDLRGHHPRPLPADYSVCPERGDY